MFGSLLVATLRNDRSVLAFNPPNTCSTDLSIVVLPLDPSRSSVRMRKCLTHPLPNRAVAIIRWKYSRSAGSGNTCA